MRAQNIGDEGLLPGVQRAFLGEGLVIPPVLHSLEMRMRSAEAAP